MLALDKKDSINIIKKKHMILGIPQIYFSLCFENGKSKKKNDVVSHSRGNITIPKNAPFLNYSIAVSPLLTLHPRVLKIDSRATRGTR